MKRQAVLDILARHHAELQRMEVASLALFGSVARDEALEDSDIDLLIEFKSPVGLFDFVRVRQFLEQILGGGKVDLVMSSAIIEELRENILKESVRAA